MKYQGCILKATRFLIPPRVYQLGLAWYLFACLVYLPDAGVDAINSFDVGGRDYRSGRAYMVELVDMVKMNAYFNLRSRNFHLSIILNYLELYTVPLD